MLSYKPVFVRGLVLVWLATWMLADPLHLLQALVAPQSDVSARHVFRSGGVEKQIAQHHANVLIGSPTEGNSARRGGAQSDEFVAADPAATQRFDRARLLALTFVSKPVYRFSASTAPRAPTFTSL